MVAETGRQDRRYHWAVLTFFVSTFVLLSSGRLDNYDPLSQLQAATALARTGSLGIRDPSLQQLPKLWIHSESGLWYEEHDIGGALFLLPAAIAGAAASPGRSDDDLIRQPPWIGRAVAALEYAALGGVACYWLFCALAHFYARRRAFLLTAAFAFGTIFWAYTKSSFDVLGGCAGVCGLLAAGAAIVTSAAVRTRDVVFAALAFTMAALFRFSVAPFLLAALLAAFCLRPLPGAGRLRARQAALAAGIIAAGFAPTLWYNAVRTAAPLRTATTGTSAPTSALQGSVPHGLYGLWLSPNRGLLVFAPVFLLLLVLPFVWRRIPVGLRRLMLCFGGGALLYMLVIARMNRWAGDFGWGPRYLVPVLPILWLGPAAVLAAAWPRPRLRAAALCLLAVSGALNAVPVLVNHRLAGQADPAVLDPDTPYPAQQAAAWRALGLGLRGIPLPATSDIVSDPLRNLQRNFPDLWAARLIEISRKGAAAAAASVALLGGAAAWSLRTLLGAGRSGRQVDKTL